uniref:Uncharacterized protein n=1 Tax=Anguilla anguilla TaxID=7936 RepID=A0A0E9R3V6_ANGAN
MRSRSVPLHCGYSQFYSVCYNTPIVTFVLLFSRAVYVWSTLCCSTFCAVFIVCVMVYIVGLSCIAVCVL